MFDPSHLLHHWPLLLGFQIGPKIRIGGTLGKIGQNVKVSVGKALENPMVDAALQMIPGVGPAVSALAGGLGTAFDTSGGSRSLGDILKGGATGFAAGKVGSFLPDIGGLSGVGSDINSGLGGINGLVTKIPGVSGLGDAIGKIPGGISTIGKALAGGSGGGTLGGLTPLDIALGGAQAINAASLQKKANDLTNSAKNYATNAYDANAPLRDAGRSGMLNAASYNPYSKAPGSAPVNTGQSSGVTPLAWRA